MYADAAIPAALKQIIMSIFFRSNLSSVCARVVVEPNHIPDLHNMATPLRVALIGHGAIGSVVAEAIAASTHGLAANRVRLVAVLVRSPETAALAGAKLPHAAVTTDPEVFFSAGPFDVCVEAAGQPAVRSHADRVLRSGCNFLCTSIGALTDSSLYEVCDVHDFAQLCLYVTLQ